MAEIVHTVIHCEPVAGTDRTRVTLQGETGAYTFELTQAAVESLLPALLAQPRTPGSDTVASNAITPLGCTPFESRQGICGLAFNLGDRYLHVAVPANGIDHVRNALAAIEAVYGQQKKAGP